MGHFTIVDIVVLCLYFGSMAALGPIFAHKGRTTEGYFLGDRSFPGWLVGFSMFATSISSVTFVAYPADAYKTAWYRMTPNYMLPLAILIASYFFLPFFRRTHITSAYEYLEDRFGPKTRLYAACAFIIMQVMRISMILYLVAILVHEMTGLNPYVSILVGGIITSFYTVLGGIRAVVWTDFIQAMVLWIGGMISLFVIIHRMPDGLGQIFSIAHHAHKFSMYDMNDSGVLEPVKWGPDLSQKTVSLFLLVGLSNWLNEYCSNQNVIQRYAAAKSSHEARVAMWVCCIFSVPTWALFMFIGTALYAFFHVFHTDQAAAMLNGGAKPEQILPYFVINYLPEGFTGLVIAGVLAAAMSSLSSSINGVSAVWHTDIYKRWIAPGRDDRHYVLVAKLVGAVQAVIMIVGAALFMKIPGTTLQNTGTILAALTGGGLLGLYLLGFFTKRGDDRAMLAGIACTIVFSSYMALVSMGWVPKDWVPPIHIYYVGLLGNILMFIVGYTLALLIPRRTNNLDGLTVWTPDPVPALDHSGDGE